MDATVANRVPVFGQHYLFSFRFRLQINCDFTKSFRLELLTVGRNTAIFGFSTEIQELSPDDLLIWKDLIILE